MIILLIIAIVVIAAMLVADKIGWDGLLIKVKDIINKGVEKVKNIIK